jgi:hypothetical protein
VWKGGREREEGREREREKKNKKQESVLLLGKEGLGIGHQVQ